MSTVVDTTRPSRAEIEPAALELVRRHGAQIMACARRYAATPEDAEDAYQRGLEILLTKAPSTHEDDLVPWLKTVVKHEAFALRKQRERHGVPTEQDTSAPAHTNTHEHVERLDTLQRGAEAMQRLKPQEIRCILLLAEGHSYAEICEITGFSYTKVNRCLAEGRQSFMQRVERIESGAECKRLAPLLSAAADGEAGADDMLDLRRHMRGCLACRAALREARHVPARVAALAPAGVVLAPHLGTEVAAAPDRLHAAWQWLHGQATSLALRGQEAFETVAAHKAVAVAASAAVLAGGGAATIQAVPDHAPARTAALKRAPVAPATAPKLVVAPRPATRARRHVARPVRTVRRSVAARQATVRVPPPSTPVSRPSARSSAPTPAAAPRAAPLPQPAPEKTRHRSQEPGQASGEFGP